MSKAANIAEGLGALLLKDESREILARRRLTYCEPCGDRRGLFCGVCKCAIAAKVRVYKEFCPLNKWSQEDENSI